MSFVLVENDVVSKKYIRELKFMVIKLARA